MSKNPQENERREEVDVGQLFLLIGKGFNKLFSLTENVFKKLFFSFVWLIVFIKKHIIKFVIAAILGYLYGVFVSKTADPVYKSYITVKQNYATGENLYNTVSYFNDLVKQKDVETLKKVLNIDSTQASSIIEFDIESVISENKKIKNFDEYRKELDTSIAKSIDYETYLSNSKDYMHSLQQITIKAKERNNFKVVFDKFVDNINSNTFFKREQEKDLSELKEQEKMLKEALLVSDSLKKAYVDVLRAPKESNRSSSTSIILQGDNDKSLTNEFELYKNDLKIRDRLVRNFREQQDKMHILEIVSSKQESGTIDNTKSLLGFSFNPKIYHSILFFVITFGILISLLIFKEIERYSKI